MKTDMKGFTLIELMIAVVIVSIIAAVAFPSYQNSVKKAKRGDAKAALLSAAQAMEQRYSTNNSYAGATLSDTAGTTVVFVDHAPSSGAHANRYYDLSFSSLSATSFTLTATRTGAMASDECGNFTLTNTGVKGVSGGSLTTADCW